jgi:hypothetical protein
VKLEFSAPALQSKQNCSHGIKCNHEAAVIWSQGGSPYRAQSWSSRGSSISGSDDPGASYDPSRTRCSA